MLLNKKKIYIYLGLHTTIYLSRSGVPGVAISYRLEGSEFESR